MVQLMWLFQMKMSLILLAKAESKNNSMQSIYTPGLPVCYLF